MVFVMVIVHDDGYFLPILLACIIHLCVLHCASRLQHRDIIIFVVADDLNSPSSMRLTRLLISPLAICIIVLDEMVSVRSRHIVQSTTEDMGPIPGLAPTQRTHVLAAFRAAVQGQLVVPVTRVAFGGVDPDFYKGGVEPRHAWCARCWIGDRCWRVESGCVDCSCHDEAVRLYHLSRIEGIDGRIKAQVIETSDFMLMDGSVVASVDL